MGLEILCGNELPKNVLKDSVAEYTLEAKYH